MYIINYYHQKKLVKTIKLKKNMKNLANPENKVCHKLKNSKTMEIGASNYKSQDSRCLGSQMNH